MHLLIIIIYIQMQLTQHTLELLENEITKQLGS